jgi:hypothetical protein
MHRSGHAEGLMDRPATELQLQQFPELIVDNRGDGGRSPLEQGGRAGILRPRPCSKLSICRWFRRAVTVRSSRYHNGVRPGTVALA